MITLSRVHSIDVRDPLVWLIGLGVSVAVAMLLNAHASRLTRLFSVAPSFPAAFAGCVAILGIGGVAGMLIRFRGDAESGLAAGFGMATLLEIISVVLLFTCQRGS